MTRRILILGATSAIAQQAARRWAQDGATFYLVGRDPEKLQALSRDLVTRGAKDAGWSVADSSRVKAANIFAEAEADNPVDTVLIAQGTLGNQDQDSQDPVSAEEVLQTNFIAPLYLIQQAANRFRNRRKGTIVAISSVAGDRGRQSNYIYGASKAAMSTYLQGLRNDLYSYGVQVVTVKPGFVATPMTAAFPHNALYTDARSVGEGIVAAVERGADIVYLPWFWRWIMLVIKSIPEWFFKRMRL